MVGRNQLHCPLRLAGLAALLVSCSETVFFELGTDEIALGAIGEVPLGPFAEIKTSIWRGGETHRAALGEREAMVVVRLERSQLVDELGEQLEPDLPWNAGEVDCNAPALDWPLRVGPGESCPIPFSATVEAYRQAGSQLTEVEDGSADSLIEAVRTRLVLRRTGERPAIPAERITPETLRTCPLDPEDALRFEWLSVAADGHGTALAPGHIVLTTTTSATWIRHTGPVDAGPLLAIPGGALYSDQVQMGRLELFSQQEQRTIDLRSSDMIPSGLSMGPDGTVYVAGGTPAPASGARLPALATCNAAWECQPESLFRGRCDGRRLVAAVGLSEGRGVALGEGSQLFVRNRAEGSWDCRFDPAHPLPTEYAGEEISFDDAIESSLAVIDDVAFFTVHGSRGAGCLVFRAPVSFDDQPIAPEIVAVRRSACASATRIGDTYAVVAGEGDLSVFDRSGQLVLQESQAGIEGPYAELGSRLRRLHANGRFVLAESATAGLFVSNGERLSRVFGPTTLSFRPRAGLVSDGDRIVSFGPRVLEITADASECGAKAIELGTMEGVEQVHAALRDDLGFVVSGRQDGEELLMRVDEAGNVRDSIAVPRPIVRLTNLGATTLVLTDVGELRYLDGMELREVTWRFDDPMTSDTESTASLAFTELDGDGVVAWAGGRETLARIVLQSNGPTGETFWLRHVIPNFEIVTGSPTVMALRVHRGDHLRVGLRADFREPGVSDGDTRSVHELVRGAAVAPWLSSVEVTTLDVGEGPAAFLGPDGEAMVTEDGQIRLPSVRAWVGTGRGVFAAETAGEISVTSDARGVLGVVFAAH